MAKRRSGQGLVIDPATLTVSVGAVTPNCDLSNQFNIDTNANFTINNPTNGTDGDIITFRIKNSHATNTITITFGSIFRFGTLVLLADVNTIIALKTSYIICRYNGADSKFDIVGSSPGF